MSPRWLHWPATVAGGLGTRVISQGFKNGTHSVIPLTAGTDYDEDGGGSDGPYNIDAVTVYSNQSSVNNGYIVIDTTDSRAAITASWSLNSTVTMTITDDSDVVKIQTTAQLIAGTAGDQVRLLYSPSMDTATLQATLPNINSIGGIYRVWIA